MQYKKIRLCMYDFDRKEREKICRKLLEIGIDYIWVPQTMGDQIWLMIKIEDEKIIPMEFKKITFDITKEEYKKWEK